MCDRQVHLDWDALLEVGEATWEEVESAATAVLYAEAERVALDAWLEGCDRVLWRLFAVERRDVASGAAVDRGAADALASAGLAVVEAAIKALDLIWRAGWVCCACQLWFLTVDRGVTDCDFFALTDRIFA